MLLVAQESISDIIEAAQAAERSGELAEALVAYERAWSLVPNSGSATDAACLLRWMGTLHRRRGDLELAEEAYLASEAVAAANTDTINVASALNCLGVVAQARAQVGEAESYYTQARDLASTCSAERLAAMIDQNLGTLANTRGDFQKAIDAYLSALKRFQQLKDDVACVWALNNLGMAYVDMSEWGAASSCFDDAFDIADRLRDPELLGMIELNRAELLAKKKELRAARESCDRAYEIFHRINSRGYLAEVCKFYGVIYRDMTRPALAISHFENALQLATEAEDRLLEAETLAEWALLDLQSGDNRGALHRLNRAHQLFGELHASADLLDLDVRLDRLEQTYMRVMERWAESIESKDRYTAGHCQRVADYACMLAAEVGFTGRDLTWFRMGAFLHDVGKTAVDVAVLNKPGALTDEEWEQMRRHTTVGDQIVAEMDFPWDIRPIVRNHHERWDGTGYPDKLAGEDIPLTARILCVADVYDALTSARSYRPALSQDDALRIMQRDSGRLVDPQLFEIFRSLVAAA